MKKDRNKIKWLFDELPRLVENKTLDQEAAESLRNYYGPVEERFAGPVLMRTFAVIGSLLIGLGVILLFGYNWEAIPKVGKTILAFLPLTVSTALGAFALFRKAGSRAWVEASSLSIALSSAACIGLISQTYQIDGSLRDFYLSWIWLVLPLLYVFRANSIFLLLSLVTVFWMPFASRNTSLVEVLSFVAVNGSCFHFLWQKLKGASSEALFFAYSVSTCVGLFSLFGDALSYFWPVWTSMYFCAIYLWSEREDRGFFEGRYRFTGYAARVGLLFVSVIASFDDSWRMIGRIGSFNEASDWAGLMLAMGLVATYGFLLYESVKKGDWPRVVWSGIPAVVLIVSALPFLWSELAILAPVVVNLCLFFLGLYLIVAGYRKTSIASLNQGLIIVVCVAVARFFDSDISMLYRGIGFVLIGVAFLTSNLTLLKKRKEMEDE